MVRPISLLCAGAAFVAAKPSPRISYESILLKFDSECLSDGDKKLSEIIIENLKERPFEGLDVSMVQTLFDDSLDAQSAIVRSHADQHDREDVAARFHRPNTFVDSPIAGRTLGNTPPNQREDEIMGALHLLAVAKLGGKGAAKLLAFEHDKDVEAAIGFLSGQLDDSTAAKVRALKAQVGDEFLMRPISYDYLDGSKVVRNPILGKTLLDLAGYLPCMELHPSPNVGVAAPEFEDTMKPVERKGGPRAVVLETMDIINKETMLARMSEEILGDVSFNSDYQNQTFIFTLGDEGETTGHAWQNQTPRPDAVGSAGIYSGWFQIAYELELKKNPDLIHEPVVRMDYKAVMERIKCVASPVTVAVLDSGVARHPDLVGQLWRNPNMPGCSADTFEGTGIDPDDNQQNPDFPGACVGYDFGEDKADPTTTAEANLTVSQRHGSFVASVLAAAGDNGDGIVGVCPWCKVMFIKIRAADGYQWQTAIGDAYNMVHKKVNDLGVMNMSYAHITQYDEWAEYFTTWLKLIEKRGVLPVAGAGNDACNIDPALDHCVKPGEVLTPGGLSIPNKILVGANSKIGRLSSYSNYGSAVDVFAPGDNLAAIGGIDGVSTGSGTSYSSPVMAGIAAVLRSIYPNLTNEQLGRIVMESAAPMKSLSGFGKYPAVAQLHRALAWAKINEA